jgi:hypothetical protein
MEGAVAAPSIHKLSGQMSGDVICYLRVGPMKRIVLVLGSAAIAIVQAAAAAGESPLLRTARAVNGHVVVTFTVGKDLLPGTIAVATRASTTAGGAFPRTAVRLREVITARSNSEGVVRFETRKKLRPDIYYVEVSAIDTAG